MRPVRIIIATLTLSVLTLLHPNDAKGQFLFVAGGDVTLTIGAPLAAGLDPQPAVNNSRRLWFLFAPRQRTKITVSTLISSQNFDLYVEAVNVFGGTPTSEVPLLQGMTATDFVVNIRPRQFLGIARLAYRAEAPAERGNSATHGNDVHTVIYTWTAQ